MGIYKWNLPETSERNYIKKNPNAVELKISTGITGEISEKVADGFHRNFDWFPRLRNIQVNLKELPEQFPKKFLRKFVME